MNDYEERQERARKSERIRAEMEEDADRLRRAEAGVLEMRVSRHAEIRSEQSKGVDYISGYAARYNVLSTVLVDRQGSFRERIVPGAFRAAVERGDDVKALVNHNPSLILGRVKNGNVELSEDSQGLHFRCRVPDTTTGRDLLTSLSRGDIDECSFAFRSPKDRWVNEGSQQVRELLDIGELSDVSVVTFPAYPETSVAVGRSCFPDGIPAEIRSRMATVLTQSAEIPDAEYRARARLRLKLAMLDD